MARYLFVRPGYPYVALLQAASVDINILRLAGHPLVEIGSPAFRRFILDLIPHKKLQSLKNVIDTMTKKSSEIFNSKKQALQAGDEAVVQELSEGKDIMSILSTFCKHISDNCYTAAFIYVM